MWRQRLRARHADICRYYGLIYRRFAPFRLYAAPAAPLPRSAPSARSACLPIMQAAPRCHAARRCRRRCCRAAMLMSFAKRYSVAARAGAPRLIVAAAYIFDVVLRRTIHIPIFPYFDFLHVDCLIFLLTIVDYRLRSYFVLSAYSAGCRMAQARRAMIAFGA
jgi:hypothetical protein